MNSLGAILSRPLSNSPRVSGRGAPVAIGSVVANVLDGRFVRRAELTARILDLWPAILPRHLAGTCTPVQLVDGVLTVETLSPSYSFDLHCESPNILNHLRNDFGNKIRKLNIVLAESSPPMSSLKS